MNIIVPDSWLRDFLKTPAKPADIARMLSLCAASVERVEKTKDDFLYHVEITTNRVDLASVYGLAREASSVFPRFNVKAKLNQLSGEKPKLALKPQVDYLQVKIADPNLCPRFTAVLLENVEIKPSPAKIQERLTKCGIRPINNVVDISNYVMLELGQPMHTFDYDKISGSSMLMRLSKRGESIITLDESKRSLPEGSIVIEDGKGRVIDLCGIMGGANSAISQSSTNVLLFVQTYDPVRIRQTCQKMSFRTDAATLFEKSLDPENVPAAMERAVKLLEETSGGKAKKTAIDIYPKPYKQKGIKLDLSDVEKIIGVKIPPKEIIDILTSLGFDAPNTTHPTLSVTVPSYRAQDISIPEDLVEEVARLFGYHNLPVSLPPGEIPQIPHEQNFYWENRAKNALKFWGFTETYNYSMVSSSLLQNCGIDPKKTLKISNPLSEDLTYMRPSLLPSLLSVYQKNQNVDPGACFFEMSNTYQPRKNDLPTENLRLSGIAGGENFLKIKGIAESLLNDLGISNYNFFPLSGENQLWNLGKTAVIKIKGEELGIVGEIHPQVTEKFAVKGRVSVFDLDFSLLSQMAKTVRKYQPISQYPPIIEDLAIIADRKILTADLTEAIKSISKLISEVNLWDTFQNTRTFRITYQSMKKTLDDREVGEIRKKTIELLRNKFSAEIKTIEN